MLSHRGGYISGDCSAGYYCLSGSDEFTPEGYPPPANGECTANTVCAGPCPAGHYCLEGTVLPTPCAQHTVRQEPGAANVSECVTCPAGYWCLEGKTAGITIRRNYIIDKLMNPA